MKLVAYLRVSTDRQAEHGLGLDVQERGIHAWTRANEHRIVLTTSDKGISGAKEVGDRPGLAQALAHVEDSGAGLVVYRLDRLARELTLQEAVLAQVWRHGGRAFTVDLGEVVRDDPDDPMRTAMRQMVGVFAQLERAMITSRMRAGKRLKASNGGYAAGGPPLGFRAERGCLVPDDRPRIIDGVEVPSEAATLARILELRSAGTSLRGIATVLTDEGYRPKRGGPWHSAQLSQVLARAQPPQNLASA